jgi:hypothetical protein
MNVVSHLHCLIVSSTMLSKPTLFFVTHRIVTAKYIRGVGDFFGYPRPLMQELWRRTASSAIFMRTLVY